MKIVFLWENNEGRLSPICHSNVINHEGVSILSCLLMDDGGSPFPDTLLWIDEGINMIESVATGKTDHMSWNRESWGAKLTKSEVTIFLYTMKNTLSQ